MFSIGQSVRASECASAYGIIGLFLCLNDVTTSICLIREPGNSLQSIWKRVVYWPSLQHILLPKDSEIFSPGFVQRTQAFQRKGIIAEEQYPPFRCIGCRAVAVPHETPTCDQYKQSRLICERTCVDKVHNILQRFNGPLMFHRQDHLVEVRFANRSSRFKRNVSGDDNNNIRW